MEEIDILVKSDPLHWCVYSPQVWARAGGGAGRPVREHSQHRSANHEGLYQLVDMNKGMCPEDPSVAGVETATSSAWMSKRIASQGLRKNESKKHSGHWKGRMTRDHSWGGLGS